MSTTRGITGPEITSLRELSTALIEARIAAPLTQRQLSERVGVTEHQIQLWEAHDYSGVSIYRLQDIADAVGIKMHGTITYSCAAHRKPDNCNSGKPVSKSRPAPGGRLQIKEE